MINEVYARTKHVRPYIFEVVSKDASLKYFGARHSANPHDVMFEHLHTIFLDFKPDVVFVEGLQSEKVKENIVDLVTSISYSEAIKRGGESVYTVKLALEHGVPWICPEPEDRDLYAHLVSLCGFSQSHVAAWNLMRLVPQWQRRDEEMSFEVYAESYVYWFKKNTEWPDFDYSYAHAMEAIEGVLGEKLNLDDRVRAGELVDPICWDHICVEWTVINRIAKASSEYRDEHIVTSIGKRLLEGGRVLVVYGASHAVIQEPAFRFLLKE